MSLVIIQRLSADEIKMRGIKNWPIWDIKTAVKKHYNFE